MEEQNQQPVEAQEVVPTTEVTSIAKEEARTGQEVKVPSVEELVSKAQMSFIINRKKFGDVFAKLSARGKNRVMSAVLDLPMDGLPVYLKGDIEKLGFALGQRIISDRFLITQHHINEEVKRIREEKAAQALAPQAEVKTETNEGEIKNG